MRGALPVLAAVSFGVWLAYVDRHTDDSGVEAGLLFLVTLGLALAAPGREWIVALATGCPLVLSYLVTGGDPSVTLVFVLAFAGALAAWSGRRIAGDSSPTRA